MSTNHVEGLKCLQESYGKLAKNCPSVMKIFGDLHAKATEDSELSLKAKELIDLGIAIVVKCGRCIQSHVKTVLEAGATRKEIAETVDVAILMGGGPATVYGSMTIESMDKYLSE